jgi:protein O-mannosyl-transferase
MLSAAEPGKGVEALAERRDGWRLLAGGVAAVVLAVFAVYWRALRGEFLWDDLLVVHKNPLVTGELGLGSIWFRTDFPLTNVAFWLEWLAWGDHPMGYHVVNVLLHAASAVLLWRVLARLRIPAGWLAAMIFAVHPMCVASVAWISELKNALSLPFYLLSILWYLRFTSEPRTSDFGLRTYKWYWLSLLAFVLALLSKTSTVMLPVVLLGCAWWRRGRVGAPDWLLASPFLVLALNFGLMSVGFQAQGAMAGLVVQNGSLGERLAGAGMALWFYLGKALLPLHLSMIYPRWTIEVASAWSYLPLLLWCGVLVVCWAGRRSWGRHVLFGLGCFTVTLFPILGFFDMYFLALSRVSDHFVYLPLTALVALAAAGLDWALKGRALVVVGAVLVAGLAVLAVLRAQVFVSEEALWRDTLDRNPAAWCAHANLGWILASQQKYAEAREHLEASLKLHAENAQAHSNLGRVLALQGQFAEAEGEFIAAVRIKPKDADIRRSYASALTDQGKKDEAVRQLRELLQLKPDMEARSQLATLLYQTAKFGEAVAEYRQVLAVKLDQPEVLSNLAWLLATSPDSAVRNGADAVRFAEQCCRLTGYQRPQMISVLAAAYAEAGRFTEAVATAQKAIELAKAGSDTRFAAVNEQLLSLYRAGKPYHMPPPTAARPGTE